MYTHVEYPLYPICALPRALVLSKTWPARCKRTAGNRAAATSRIKVNQVKPSTQQPSQPSPKERKLLKREVLSFPPVPSPFISSPRLFPSSSHLDERDLVVRPAGPAGQQADVGRQESDDLAQRDPREAGPARPRGAEKTSQPPSLPPFLQLGRGTSRPFLLSHRYQTGPASRPGSDVSSSRAATSFQDEALFDRRRHCSAGGLPSRGVGYR